MESRIIEISHNKSQLVTTLLSLFKSAQKSPFCFDFLSGLVALVVRDLLHWRINALPQLAQGRPREMATRPGHFCLSESNFLEICKPSYLKEYHAPQGQISGKITQLHGINYEKTFSPVGKPVTIWTVLSCLTGASLREGRKRIASLVYHASILAGMFSPQSHAFSLRHLIRDGMAYQWIYKSLPQQLMALARSKDIEGLACRAIVSYFTREEERRSRSTQIMMKLELISCQASSDATAQLSSETSRTVLYWFTGLP